MGTLFTGLGQALQPTVLALYETMIKISGASPAPSVPNIRFDGERVFIRPPRPEDFAAWADLRAQSRDFLVPWEPVWPDNALQHQTYLRRLRRQLNEWRDDVGYHFLVFARDNEKIVGGIGLTQVRRGVAQTGTVGYWVGAPFARKGYTGEAVTLVLEFAFETLGLHRVEAACLPSNDASGGLLAKVGFAKEGYARGYLRINGKWEDHILWAMLRDDWDEQRATRWAAAR